MNSSAFNCQIRPKRKSNPTYSQNYPKVKKKEEKKRKISNVAPRCFGLHVPNASGKS